MSAPHTSWTTILRRLGLGVATVGVLVATAGPAAAIDPGGGEPPSPPPATGGGVVTGPTTGTVADCSVVSSPSFLGLSCGSAAGDDLTPKQILKGDPVPGCWHEPLTEAELAATGYQNYDGKRWYWERCLKGINPKTYKVQPGGIRFTIGIVSLSPGETKKLTGRQQDLVRFNDDNTQVPAPVAVTSPSPRPRVGAWVSFFNGTEDTVTAGAGGVQLVARISDIEVLPLGSDSTPRPSVGCAGTGYRAERGETPASSRPGACWFRYDRSSAGQRLVDTTGQPAYPVLITATWQVSTVVGGVSTPFNSFTKSQVTSLPVTEVQSLVIN